MNVNCFCRSMRGWHQSWIMVDLCTCTVARGTTEQSFEVIKLLYSAHNYKSVNLLWLFTKNINLLGFEGLRLSKSLSGWGHSPQTSAVGIMVCWKHLSDNSRYAPMYTVFTATNTYTSMCCASVLLPCFYVCVWYIDMYHKFTMHSIRMHGQCILIEQIACVKFKIVISAEITLI